MTEESLPQHVEAQIYEAFFENEGEARRQALDAILREHAAHGDKIRAVIDELATGDKVFASAAEVDPPPPVIGPYEIGRKLGEGGFGVVYHAEQREPIAREVALKLIRPGMDSAAVIGRFETERRTLARLDHPSIARVLDAGVTSSGRPWFVMEYVPGAAITQYCDDNRLDIRARLSLFLEVCDAVQHAHQRGILHRDLKPSNVLVRIQDERAVPKIIDFGIAKAIHAVDDEVERTEFGRLLGTPEYMCPEQAEGSLDIDTRADVYSLGMLLYVMLVGALPFDSKSFKRSSSDAIARFLRENDAKKPSTRVRSVDDPDSVASRRRIDRPVALASALRGELDWITMKAIDRDRTRRYPTVAGLADDIRLYLAGDPVTAGPPSKGYVLSKLLRKHRGTVVAASAVLLVLVAGLIASLLMWQRARVAEEQANENAKLARSSEKRAVDSAREAEANATAAKESELKAQEYLADFKTLSDRLELAELGRLQAGLWPEHPGRIDAMEAWLQRARALTATREEGQKKLTRIRERSGELVDGRWTFAARSDRFLHESLETLLRDIGRLADPKKGFIADVASRLVQAKSIRARTITDRTAEWRAALAELKEDPRFDGVEIEPQIGLVPIGADPDTKLQEFAHLRSGRVPLRGPDGRIKKAPDMCMVFVLLPPGEFLFGAQKSDPKSPNYEAGARDFETPVKTVRMDAFFCAKYEMTQAQYRAWTGTNPSRYPAGGTHGKLRIGWLHPIENVTWHDATRVLGQLGLALPTEAQWEYACRAGTTSAFYSGPKLHSLQGYENLADEAAGAAGFLSPVQPIRGFRDRHGPHGPIGSYRPNPFGLHDLLGNVSEWCFDRFGAASLEPRHGDGLRDAPRGARALRSFRGGSFGSNSRLVRTGRRSMIDESVKAGPLGLRAVRAIER